MATQINPYNATRAPVTSGALQNEQAVRISKNARKGRNRAGRKAGVAPSEDQLDKDAPANSITNNTAAPARAMEDSSAPSSHSGFSGGVQKLSKKPDAGAELQRVSTAAHPSKSQSSTSTTCGPQATNLDGSVFRNKPKEGSEIAVQETVNSVIKQQVDDWRLMIRQQRLKAMDGPKITVNIGTLSIHGIAKRAAMAISRTLNAHFVKHPEDPAYNLKPDELDADAVRTLLITWPQKTCQDFQAGELAFQDTFRDDVALLRPARVLGMERYTKSILDCYVGYLYTELPQYNEIIIIEHMATSDKDPLWTKMVNRLAQLQYQKRIPDPDVFAAFLEKHPKVSRAMKISHEYFKNRAEKQRSYQKAKEVSHHKEGRSMNSTGAQKVTAEEVAKLHGR